MTYTPAQIPPDDGARQVDDLAPWKDAADLIGVRHGTLARWVDRGKLPYITVDGRRYVNVTTAARLEAATRHRRRTG